MADTDHSGGRLLANGKTRIDFQTEPARYRHWKLNVDGDVATLVMDVDEKGALFGGYELKLNSYDLGVDIELADALERLRFEHPQVRAVVLRSGKPRVFSAGANIRMLAGATHAHKVNFCKFTNETRNGIEDLSENSGLKTICAINGTAAGGGYELALASDYIMLVDDGSAAVSLPELPLLAVLPGTGGLTRVSDKRKVRRDHADVFCTTEEGVKGKRAVEWRLVDDVVTGSKFDDAVAARAKEFAAKSPRNGGGKGIALSPLTRTFAADSVEYGMLSVEFQRTERLATITLRGPTEPPPLSADAMLAQGANFWPLQLARELDDAILHIRINELEVAAIVFKSSGDPASVLAYDRFLDANKDYWLAREIRLLWKRVLKRVDLTSRSLVTLIEPGSCFAGTLAELSFASDRSYMLIGTREGDNNSAGGNRARRCQFRPLSDVERTHPAGLPLPRQSRGHRHRKSRTQKNARCRGCTKARAHHLCARRHRLGRRGARVSRRAREFLARQPHRPRSQSALRRSGDHGIENLRPADRMAELDFPAPQCDRRRRRTETLRHRSEAGVRHEKGLMRAHVAPTRSIVIIRVGG